MLLSSVIVKMKIHDNAAGYMASCLQNPVGAWPYHLLLDSQQ